MKVLIVDDEKNLLEMIQSTISWNSLGITEVLTAYEGVSALAIIRAQSPDIVITDIEMPVMDGLQLSRRIREEIPDPPEIIFLSCHAEFGYAQQALQVGATNYLLKPFLPEELTAVLSKTIVTRTEKQRNRQLHDQAAAYESNRDYMERGFLRDILDHAFEGSPEALAKEAARRNIPLNISMKSHMVAVGTNVEEALKSYSKSELVFIFRNIINEVMYGLDQARSANLVEHLGRSHYTAYLFLREDSCTRQAVDSKCARHPQPAVDRYVYSGAYHHSRQYCAVLYGREGFKAGLRRRVSGVLSFLPGQSAPGHRAGCDLSGPCGHPAGDPGFLERTGPGYRLGKCLFCLLPGVYCAAGSGFLLSAAGAVPVSGFPFQRIPAGALFRVPQSGYADPDADYAGWGLRRDLHFPGLRAGGCVFKSAAPAFFL